MAPLTGRKVLIFTLAAFGTVIAVNVTLAVQAVRTFPGLEVRNSYVASQAFDAERAAQEALGWNVEANYEAGVLRIAVTDAGGGAAEVGGLNAVVGRPTSTRDDVQPEFRRNGAVFTAPLPLRPGVWNVRLAATAADGTAFRQRLVLRVPAGGSG